MKTFKEFLNENALEAGQKDQAIADSVLYLNKELRKIFPEEEWSIQVSASPMNGGVAVDFYNSNSARRNIRQNSSTFMQFMMHLTGRFGNEEDLPTVSWEQINTNAYSVKFRKINSKKSTKDADQKLVAWFKKNKESIYALEGLNESPDENLDENLLDTFSKSPAAKIIVDEATKLLMKKHNKTKQEIMDALQNGDKSVLKQYAQLISTGLAAIKDL